MSTNSGNRAPPVKSLSVVAMKRVWHSHKQHRLVATPQVMMAKAQSICAAADGDGMLYFAEVRECPAQTPPPWGPANKGGGGKSATKKPPVSSQLKFCVRSDEIKKKEFCYVWTSPTLPRSVRYNAGSWPDFQPRSCWVGTSFRDNATGAYNRVFHPILMLERMVAPETNGSASSNNREFELFQSSSVCRLPPGRGGPGDSCHSRTWTPCPNKDIVLNGDTLADERVDSKSCIAYRCWCSSESRQTRQFSFRRQSRNHKG